MGYISWGRFATKLMAIGAIGAGLNLPVGDEVKLELLQSILKGTANMWNAFAMEWNESPVGKKRLLDFARDNVFFNEAQRLHPQESALVMDAAAEAKILPLLKKIDESTLILEDPLTEEEVLRLEDLDALKGFTE